MKRDKEQVETSLNAYEQRQQRLLNN